MKSWTTGVLVKEEYLSLIVIQLVFIVSFMESFCPSFTTKTKQKPNKNKPQQQ